MFELAFFDVQEMRGAQSVNHVDLDTMRAPTILRKKASAHCTGVPVGARIARPHFVQNLLFAQLL